MNQLSKPRNVFSCGTLFVHCLMQGPPPGGQAQTFSLERFNFTTTYKYTRAQGKSVLECDPPCVNTWNTHLNASERREQTVFLWHLYRLPSAYQERETRTPVWILKWPPFDSPPNWFWCPRWTLCFHGEGKCKWSAVRVWLPTKIGTKCLTQTTCRHQWARRSNPLAANISALLIALDESAYQSNKLKVPKMQMEMYVFICPLAFSRAVWHMYMTELLLNLTVMCSHQRVLPRMLSPRGLLVCFLMFPCLPSLIKTGWSTSWCQAGSGYSHGVQTQAREIGNKKAQKTSIVPKPPSANSKNSDT